MGTLEKRIKKQQAEHRKEVVKLFKMELEAMLPVLNEAASDEQKPERVYYALGIPFYRTRRLYEVPGLLDRVEFPSLDPVKLTSDGRLASWFSSEIAGSFWVFSPLKHIPVWMMESSLKALAKPPERQTYPPPIALTGRILPMRRRP